MPTEQAPPKSTDIRLSTRKALGGDLQHSPPEFQNSDSRRSTRLTKPFTQPAVDNGDGDPYTAQILPATSLIRPQTAAPTISSSATGKHSKGSFKNTLRRVFSLGPPEKVSQKALSTQRTAAAGSNISLITPIAEDTQSSQARRSSKASSRPRTPYLSAQTGLEENYQLPLPYSPATNSPQRTTIDNNPANPGPRVSYETHPTTSLRRLRRTKSRILRVDIGSEPEQTAPSRSFRSSKSPISPALLPSPQILRQLRPTDSLYPPNPPLPVMEPQTSKESAVRSRRDSRRDSLDVQRARYNQSSRSSSKDLGGRRTPRTSSRHPRRSSVSSLNTEAGSAKARSDTKHPQPTAPRQVMEFGGVIARLDDLESRMAEVEHSLYRFRTSSQNQDGRAGTTPSQLFHTPPSSRMENRPQKASVPPENPSTPQSDDDSGPSTPRDNPMGRLQAEPQVAAQQELPCHSLEEIETQDSAILRESLLKHGYDHTMQRVFDVVNSEHSARVALEENVRSLKHAISSLRREVETPPRPETRRGQYPKRTEEDSKRSPWATGVSASGGDTGQSSTTETLGQTLELPAGATSPLTREPLGYADLWSHAAVPLEPGYEHREVSSHDWGGGLGPESRFSFDDTNSTSGDSTRHGD